ncbi:MAG: hypothetical protein NXI30_14795 [bacterium]|nr:hypothetical protein [bacterium]
MSLSPRPLEDLRPPPKTVVVQPRLRSPRMLVIEDDPMVIPLIARALHQLDPDVVLDWARDAEEGRSALASADYYAVLADFMLADSESGYSLLGSCRFLQPAARFAMMSALPISTPQHAFGFLRKPFGVKECEAFLADLLDGIT